MGAKDFSCAVSGLCSKMCQNTEDYRYTREKTSDTQGTPAVSPMGKWLLPTGKELFVCDRLSQSKNCSRKFPWIHRKEQKNYRSLYTQTLGVGEGRLCKGGDGEAAACVCLGEKFISPTANGVVAVQTYFKALLLVCHAFCHVPGPIFSQIRQSFDRFIHAQNLCSILKFVYRQLHSLRKKPTFTVSPRNDVWGTTGEIPYWWRVTTQIRIVFLIK